MNDELIEKGEKIIEELGDEWLGGQGMLNQWKNQGQIM
jgi:hypothetical protein